MRCLNCGNENPPDNVYCNECGARLQEMSSPDLAAEGGINLGAGSGSNTDTSMSAASSMEGSATQTYTAHGTAPTHEHEAPVDHITFAPAGTAPGDGDAAHATSVGSHYIEGHDTGMSNIGAQSGHDTHVSDVDHAGHEAYNTPSYAGGAMDGSSASSSMDSQQEVPLTEDTLDTLAATGYDAPTQGGGSQHEHTDMAHMHGTDQASDDGSAPMPGVIPIAEDQQESPMVASYDEVSPAAAGIDTHVAPDMSQTTAATASGANNREWATEALHQLDEAQQAMAKGDFMGFGQSLSNLRSFLEGIINSSPVPATGAAGGAATMTPSPDSADAYQQQGLTMSSGSSGDSAASVGAGNMDRVASATSQTAPTLEPGAEAGSLGSEGAAGADATAVGATAVGAAAASGATGMAGAANQSGFVPAISQDGQSSVARLVVISTGAELALPEQEEIIVGREDPSSGIFPDVDLTPYGGEEGGVSRRHARLLRIGDDYYVEDLQSTNYTKLDGQRLPAHVRERLEDSARLDFGRVAVIFRRS